MLFRSEKVMNHLAGKGYSYRISVIKLRGIKMTAVVIRGIYDKADVDNVLAILKHEAKVEPILNVIHRINDGGIPSIKMALGYINY